MKRLMMVVALLAATLAATGCTDGRQAPPKTTVRVVHAAPGYDELAFLRVESLGTSLRFGGGATMRFDEDRYTFNVDVARPDTGAPRRLLSFSEQVSAGTEYTFVLLEVGGQLQQMVLEAPALENATGDARAVALHGAAGLSAVDLFIEPTGTDLTGAQPWGRIGFTETLPPRVLAAGGYEATLTAPGDKQNVLFTSFPFEVPADRSLLFTVVDVTGESLSPFGLAVLGDTGETLVGRSDESALRAINAAADRAPRDVIIDGDTEAPVLTALPHGQVSDYVPLTRGDREVTITPTGNPGVLELEESVAAAGGRSHTILFVGEAGELSEFFTSDEKRSLVDRAKVRFYNGSNQFGSLDIFAVTPGTDISTVPPRGTLAAPGMSATQIFPPGEVELHLRRNGTDDVVAGPISLTFEEGGVYGVLLLDGETSAIDTVLIDELE